MTRSKHRTRRKVSKRRRSIRHARKRLFAPRTAKQFFAKSQDFQDSWNRAVGVVSKMRAERVSLRHASRELDISPHSVLRLVRSALRKRRNGSFSARASDHLLRVLLVPTKNGLREITIRDSREASKLGEYWSAIRKYLQTGDDLDLQKFGRKKTTDASGKRVSLLTDLNELNRLGSAGVLSFESIYSRVA
jgi:hypothetical protein